MNELVLKGFPAAAGVAVASAYVIHDAEEIADGAGGEAERARALQALADVAADLARTAARLRDMGLVDEAEIVEANRLMSEDPSLESEVARLALELPAATAVVRATDRHAALLAGLGDQLLSARAADVRELGRRATRLLAGAPPPELPDTPVILIARDLGPAELSELQLGGGKLAGIGLAEGAATSHAAIVARALGLPLVVALGESALAVREGETVVLDADQARLVLRPELATLATARSAQQRALAIKERLAALRGRPPVTRDGRRITLLANASSAAEVQAGLDAGAEGVGLLRTELAFLDAPDWPTEAEHFEALVQSLALLRDHVATVRTLDFGQDKTPPFLAGVSERGLDLALAHPDALAAQLRAILRAAGAVRLRLLLPLVREAAQLPDVRALVANAIDVAGWSAPRPRLGAMIETPEAAAHAAEIAAEADFLSIGTNDLVQYTLGLDREQPLASTVAAASPEVLVHIAATVSAAHELGRPVEVCGEAAGEPAVAVLLLGLGVDELSVSPARLDAVRAAVRGITARAASAAAQDALRAESMDGALALGQALLDEAGHERPELLDSLGGAVA
jgi:phosphoenolpyruvate-protein kinase (PTS system EI component)